MLRNILKEFPLLISRVFSFKDGAFIEYLITNFCNLIPKLRNFTQNLIVRNFSFHNLNSPSIYIYICIKNFKDSKNSENSTLD
jgi:hypothetical protein